MTDDQKGLDENVIPEKTRAWIYRLSVAAVPLLTGYGLVSETKAGLWLGLIGAALGLGTSVLASANTSTRK